MDDVLWMQEALALAARGRGQTAPNPTVGAVIVQDGQRVGAGYHQACGQPHAEIEALREAGIAARGATAYVTLEPCCHHGRTPPCTSALIDAGIARVVVGLRDPFPQVAGQGLQQLREAGVEVVAGVLERDCLLMNLPFVTRVRTGRPLVTLKTATTLDGKIATRSGHSQWITGEEARNSVHRMRAQCDAVLVGSGTVRADDPLLTCRLPGEDVRQPRRVVLSQHGSFELDTTLVLTARQLPTTVFSSVKADAQWRSALAQTGVTLELVEGDHHGLVLEEVLQRLAQADVNEVLVEGGSEVFSSFLREGMAHRLVAFLAPLVLGDADAQAAFDGLQPRRLEEAPRLQHVTVSQIGTDARVEGWLFDFETWLEYPGDATA